MASKIFSPCASLLITRAAPTTRYRDQHSWPYVGVLMVYTNPSSSPLITSTAHFRPVYADSGEPTSGLEPLTCSLRVCGLPLLWVAQGCKSRLDNGFSVP